MGRQGSYLFRRKGSMNWYARFQYPGSFAISAEFFLGRKVKRIEDHSLGTPNRIEAEAVAAPLITTHKRLKLVHAAISSRDPKRRFGRDTWQREIEPGHYPNPAGGYTHASENEITTCAPDGTMVSRPNLCFPAIEIDEANVPPSQRRAFKEVQAKEKPDLDTEIIENYITENRRPEPDANAARAVLAAWREAMPGKSFARATKLDAKAFIEHLAEKGGKKRTGIAPGTIQRGVAQLKAALNVELNAEVPRITRNVFTLIRVEGADETDGRDAYTEDDVRKVQENMHLFDAEERLMWLWHVSSGIRPGGIYSIASDDWAEEEHPDTGEVIRTRHVRIRRDKDDARKGKKYGLRNLPIPQAVLDARHPDNSPMLPDRIDGPLFKRPLKPLLVTLNAKLAKMGVNGPRKSFYSCRDRASDRMKNRNVPKEQRAAILGHARTDIEERYGHGFTMCVLKPSIDKIGA